MSRKAESRKAESPPTLQNHAGGRWVAVNGTETVQVTNPATGEVLAIHPQSNSADVETVVAAALKAYPQWKLTPVPTRAALLFRYRHLLTTATDELAAIVTAENGKTIEESKGELLRAIQYVEHAAAAPELMKGAVTEEIGTGVDIEYIREPLGVFGIVAPFNFPAMIPLYFSWAVATGNTAVIKPSELCPLTTIRLVELAIEAGFPPGVVNVVLGGADVVQQLAAHPDIVGLSFVGSSEIARVVYISATSNGKRCQAQGGSNNHLYVSSAAAIERCLPNIVSSLYGNASQRCFAGSNLLVDRAIYPQFVERLVTECKQLVLGEGTNASATLGPVISESARQRFVTAIDNAETQGARVLLDGRGARVEGFPDGHWLGATLVEADATSDIWRNELFGPVRCIAPVDGLNEAIEVINSSSFGHTAVIYTELGGEARRFRQLADVGQVGINVGTPAPIAFYAVGGRKSSFYGSNRGRANDAIDFYTDKKVVVTMWHGESTAPAPVDPSFEGKS